MGVLIQSSGIGVQTMKFRSVVAATLLALVLTVLPNTQTANAALCTDSIYVSTTVGAGSGYNLWAAFPLPGGGVKGGAYVQDVRDHTWWYLPPLLQWSGAYAYVGVFNAGGASGMATEGWMVLIKDC